MPMSDYLDAVTPDYTGSVFNVAPKGPNAILDASGRSYQEIDAFYGGEDARFDWGTDPVFFVALPFDNLTSAELNTILDFYLDAGKANGTTRSFPWYHPTEQTYYTVKFYRNIHCWYAPAGNVGVQGCVLRVIGNYVP